MKRSRFIMPQVVAILKELDPRCRRRNALDTTVLIDYHRQWRDSYAGLESSDLVRFQRKDRIIATHALEFDAKLIEQKRWGPRGYIRCNLYYERNADTHAEIKARVLELAAGRTALRVATLVYLMVRREGCAPGEPDSRNYFAFRKLQVGSLKKNAPVTACAGALCRR
jgi:hypothetical protein